MNPLVLQDVHHSYREAGREREVLHGVDLEVREGEVVALLGRSGSGKSTMLHVLAGIEPVSSGSVRIAGEDLGGLSERDRTILRRRRVGLVFQSFHLLPLLTVAENVGLPLELDGRLDAAARQRIEALLEQVGLAGRGQDLPERLSGGERQRVAIARALAHSPAILLADEPTGNLDRERADSVLELLLGLAREHDTAMLIATHGIEVAERCDRTVQLVDGVLEDVIHSEIGADS